jgi:hypothetical protein
MCPFCLATAAVIAGGATGTSGLTAIVAGTIFKRKRQKRVPEQDKEAEVKDGDGSDRGEASESGLAR